MHWLTYAAWPVAVLHYLTTGTDAGAPWGVALAVLAIGAVAVAVGIRIKTASVPSTVPPAARSGR